QAVARQLGEDLDQRGLFRSGHGFDQAIFCSPIRHGEFKAINDGLEFVAREELENVSFLWHRRTPRLRSEPGRSSENLPSRPTLQAVHLNPAEKGGKKGFFREGVKKRAARRKLPVSPKVTGCKPPRSNRPRGALATRNAGRHRRLQLGADGGAV